MQLAFTPKARTQAEKADTWWRANRLAAPALFDRELSTAIAQILRNPEIGLRYRRLPGARRLVLPRTRYHIYYVLLDEEVVSIISVWSGLRGRGPRLR